ncbi:urease accessory protein UreF [Nakamurella flavida]|uniref:Urease accessory protein UreF n=2 Tax=Nakamurella flavida TaxID=363630 RepID=A0A938YHJ8_9ACTN|nr:urease accessory UreF family protein [Nakamurella flavida]MBM9477815.1 urease accessory protein UreF [Nakamurella flavida]
MLLADARLPTGAHTQSAGLEPALRAGMSMAELPGYLTARLRTVTAVEAGAAVVARRVALDDPDPTDLTERLAAVDAAWRARTVSPALREVSAMLGRGYLRLVRRVWPTDAGICAVAALTRPGRAVVLGAAAAAAGLSAAQLVRLMGYEDVQTVSAAALKLEPTDPVLATLWVVRAAPEIERMVSALSDLREVAEIPARGAPLLEQWAEVHALSTQRLFRA